MQAVMTKSAQKQLSLKRKFLRKENRKWPPAPVQVPRHEWPTDLEVRSSRPRLAVWRSSKFLVQVFEEANGCKRISVNRCEVNAAGEFSDQITWDELQQLKNQIGFEKFDAVEIYPTAKDVVNIANMRHLWVLPVPFYFAWRNI